MVGWLRACQRPLRQQQRGGSPVPALPWPLQPSGWSQPAPPTASGSLSPDLLREDSL